MAALAELDAVGASSACMASLVHASGEFSRRLGSGEAMSAPVLCKARLTPAPDASPLVRRGFDGGSRRSLLLQHLTIRYCVRVNLTWEELVPLTLTFGCSTLAFRLWHPWRCPGRCCRAAAGWCSPLWTPSSQIWKIAGDSSPHH